MSIRIEKINDLVRDQLMSIIQKDLSWGEGVFISIIKVDTSPDLRYARVFVSVFPEEQRAHVLKKLTQETYFLQGKLNKQLHCRPLPKINFISDETEKKATDLEAIFEKIKKENKSASPK